MTTIDGSQLVPIAAVPVTGLVVEVDESSGSVRFRVRDEESRLSPWTDWIDLEEGSITIHTDELWKRGRFGRG